MALYGPDEPDYEPEPPEDPAEVSLQDHQPAVEPMTLDEWESREDMVLEDRLTVEQMAEDRRAEQAARAAWLRKVTERRVA